MKKSKMIPRIYGYVVCLVALITFIICIATFINALLDLSDPLHSGNRWNKASLASYENYKMDILGNMNKESSDNKLSYIPDDNAMRRMFWAEKSNHIRTVVHDSNKTILTSVILILISIALFLVHWKWMKRLNGTRV